MKTIENKRKVRIPIPGILQRNFQGNGNTYVVLLLTFVVIAAAFLTRGFLPTYLTKLPPPDPANQVTIVTPSVEPSRHVLQLIALKFEKKVPTCTQQANIVVLVDVSGSMGFGGKLPALKSALTSLTDALPPDSLFGLYKYSDGSISDAQKEVVPINVYPDVKTAAAAGIASLQPVRATWTRSAFAYMLPKLQAAQQQYPNRPISFIFFSDGIPERDHTTCGNPPGSLKAYACVPNPPVPCIPSPGITCRCFDRKEDPTDTLFGPDIAAQIRSIPISVWTIGLKDQLDTCFNTDMQNMMLRIAGDGSRFFSVDDSSRLTEFFTKIVNQICTI